ncbi:MAG TPA: hypothetical protein VF132_07475 [Rudaea sp.]
MKSRMTGVIRPLLVGLAFAIAASAANALPPGGGGGGVGCSGGDDLGACAEAGLPVWLCCWIFGM